MSTNIQIEPEEEEYLEELFPWISELDYKHTFVNFLRLRKFLLDEGWSESFERHEEESQNEYASGYIRYHRFKKEYERENSRPVFEIEIINTGKGFIHAWYHNQITGTSGNDGVDGFVECHYDELVEESFKKK